jgi:hypothetical protein
MAQICDEGNKLWFPYMTEKFLGQLSDYQLHKKVSAPLFYMRGTVKTLAI